MQLSIYFDLDDKTRLLLLFKSNMPSVDVLLLFSAQFFFEDEGRTAFFHFLLIHLSLLISFGQGNKLKFRKRFRGNILKPCTQGLRKTHYFVNPASNTKPVCSHGRCCDNVCLSLSSLLCELVCLF